MKNDPKIGLLLSTKQKVRQAMAKFEEGPVAATPALARFMRAERVWPSEV